MAVNTTGSGREPYALGLQNGQFANFSYSVVTGAAYGNGQIVLPLLIQYYARASSVGYRILNFNPATTQLNLNTATTTSYSEFQFVFQRAQLSLPPPTATQAPSPSPTPSRGNSTPSPTPSGSGSGQQTPISSPTTSSQSTWCINLFITGQPQGSGNQQVYDALGAGANDQSFSSGCFDVNSYQDIVFNQYPEAAPPVSAAATFQGFELVNFP